MPLTICTSRCEASNCLAQRRLLPVERKPIQHESRYHWDISFLTSTYNGTFLPWNLYVAEHIRYDSCEGNKSDYFTSDERWTPYGPHSHPGSRAEAKCLVNLVLPTFRPLTFRAVRESVLISQLNYDGLIASKIYNAPHSSLFFWQVASANEACPPNVMVVITKRAIYKSLPNCR